MNNLKPEHKQVWVDALRGGDFVQGSGALRSANNEYCCLGVLAQTCGNTDLWHRTTRGLYVYDDNSVQLRSTSWGLDDSILNSLEMMNDDDAKTFAEIADWIEANL